MSPKYSDFSDILHHTSHDVLHWFHPFNSNSPALPIRDNCINFDLYRVDSRDTKSFATSSASLLCIFYVIYFYKFVNLLPLYWIVKFWSVFSCFFGIGHGNCSLNSSSPNIVCAAHSQPTSVSFSTGCIGATRNFHAKRCERRTLFNLNDNTPKSTVRITATTSTVIIKFVPIVDNTRRCRCSATIPFDPIARQSANSSKQWTAQQQSDNAYQTASAYSNRSW